MTAGQTLREALLKNLFNNTAFPAAPTNIVFGLHTSDPGDIGGAAEITGNGYARVSKANNTTNFATPVDSGTDEIIGNKVDIQFGPASGGSWGTITHISAWDGAIGASKALTTPFASWAASVATYTITAHGYKVGDTVTISGVTPTGYNVTARITSVTANTFTVAMSTDPGAYVSGGAAVDLGTFLGSGAVTNAAVNDGSTYTFTGNATASLAGLQVAAA